MEPTSPGDFHSHLEHIANANSLKELNERIPGQSSEDKPQIEAVIKRVNEYVKKNAHQIHYPQDNTNIEKIINKISDLRKTEENSTTIKVQDAMVAQQEFFDTYVIGPLARGLRKIFGSD